MIAWLYVLRLHCQPQDPQEVRARSARRWRLVILILVGAVVVALSVHGFTVAGALSVVAGVVWAARMVARYVLGASPAPRAA